MDIIFAAKKINVTTGIKASDRRLKEKIIVADRSTSELKLSLDNIVAHGSTSSIPPPVSPSLYVLRLTLKGLKSTYLHPIYAVDEKDDF
jgi:hypothetical protein